MEHGLKSMLLSSKVVAEEVVKFEMQAALDLRNLFFYGEHMISASAIRGGGLLKYAFTT